MNNNKMIKTAKNLDILADIFGKIVLIAGGVSVVLAVLSLVLDAKIFVRGATSVDFDFIRAHLAQGCVADEKFIRLYAFAGSLGGGMVCIVAGYCASLFRKILAPIKDGRPFEDGTSAYFRKAGWAVMAGGLLTEITGVAARALLVRAYPLTQIFSAEAVTKTEFVSVINLDFVIITCILFFLSYIFAYGQALQKESDETL
ncbi:MAG: DUF2975 domain-containing protein [Oscillospiraceae bacterium]|nr:DUF2975 domain-containing protein [Oscillospiraceae bacterium]